MAEPPNTPPNSSIAGAPPPPPTPSPTSSTGASGKGSRYPNPPDAVNPDPTTLREQWRYATRQYARWYSSAWGTAILAGTAFFALGWLIKGGNPLPSRARELEEDHQQGRKPPAAAE